MRMQRRLAALLGPAALGLALGGCTVRTTTMPEPSYPPPGGYAQGPSGYVESQQTVAVDTAPAVNYAESYPPEPLYETMAPSPGPGYVWVDGYWHWNGYEWVWIGGSWMPEQVGFVYIEPYYDYYGGSYVYQPGHWRRREHVPHGVIVRDHRDGRPTMGHYPRPDGADRPSYRVPIERGKHAPRPPQVELQPGGQDRHRPSDRHDRDRVGYRPHHPDRGAPPPRAVPPSRQHSPHAPDQAGLPEPRQPDGSSPPPRAIPASRPTPGFGAPPPRTDGGAVVTPQPGAPPRSIPGARVVPRHTPPPQDSGAVIRVRPGSGAPPPRSAPAPRPAPGPGAPPRSAPAPQVTPRHTPPPHAAPPPARGGVPGMTGQGTMHSPPQRPMGGPPLRRRP